MWEVEEEVVRMPHKGMQLFSQGHTKGRERENLTDHKGKGDYTFVRYQIHCFPSHGLVLSRL